MIPTRAPLTGAAWCATLAAAWWTAETFAAMAGARPADLPGLLTTDPVRAAAALLAAACHLLVGYLVLLTVAAALAALSGREGAIRRVRALALPSLRPVLDAGAGWALALGAAAMPLAPTVAPALTGARAEPPPSTTVPDAGEEPPVTMRRLPDGPPTREHDAPVEVLRRLPDLDVPDTTVAPTTATTAPPADAAAPDEPGSGAVGADDVGPGTTGPEVPATPPEAATGSGPADDGAVPPPSVDGERSGAPAATEPSADDTWTIEPGDHLWHVAEATLADHGEPDASPARVLAYLERVVAANSDRLVVPGNADLVLPGQVFVLPAVTAP